MQANDDLQALPVRPQGDRSPRRRRVILGGVLGLGLAAVLAVGGFAVVQGVHAANATNGAAQLQTTGLGAGPCGTPTAGQHPIGTPPAGGGPHRGGPGGFGGPGGLGGPHGGMGGGAVTAIHGSDLTVAGGPNDTSTTVHTTASTTYMKDCKTAKFSDIAVGDRLGVRGTRNSDGTITATRIAILPPSFAGAVQSNANNVITLTDRAGKTHTIDTTNSTVVTKGPQTTAKLSDIIKGTLIMATGTLNADGSLAATRIDIRVPHAGGKITKISGDVITVTGRDNTTHKIDVTATTTYVDGPTGKATTLSALKTGEFIDAEGTLNSDGSLTATTVRVMPTPPAGGPHGPGGPPFGP